ncbi:YeeE/YedE family protein [Phreatobacter cathodiphilus]|uniref:YeeE/YedE family protein n=1 Tax=Phreatobacter cathodiphilus TaxID=1868589 RepID=A0A2S0NA81_9HYPH|nr:YeeE/YedE family protein [Phreatobacter cathodiphilus]AVO45080.1 YeeE/YedE family protein [Phreatobacter cathodiphilus]
MQGLTAITVGLIGLAVGFACGFTVQRARLCTFGAVEDALVGGNWRRLKAFGLSLALAILGAQALVAVFGFDLGTTTYVPARIALAGTLVGAILFGLGMALVGTCAFGSLVRLGTGDLRSLVTLLVFAVFAYAVLRGVLAGVRIDTVEAVALSLPAGTTGAYPDLLALWLGPFARHLAGPLVAVLLLAVALRDQRLRRSPRLLTAAVVLGLGVVVGWAVTGPLADPFASEIRVQSLTFVAPVARAFFALATGEGMLLDFGVMSVFGVVAGAAAAAFLAREFRWEAFDDQREMRRHLAGAALMGAGGVLAGGCTIGQGLTAGSLLAVSWPVAVAGMVVGARIGIAILLEGSPLEWLRALTRRGDGQRSPAE